MGFSTYGDDSITFTQSDSSERMRIASGGNVGINTTSPDNKLQVVGTVTIGSTVKAGCLKIQDRDVGGYTWCTTLDGVMLCNSTKPSVCDN